MSTFYANLKRPNILNPIYVCVIAGTVEEMPPMHGDHRVGQGPPGGRSQQERKHLIGGDRIGTQSRGDQEGTGGAEAGEEKTEKEREAREGTYGKGGERARW